MIAATKIKAPACRCGHKKSQHMAGGPCVAECDGDVCNCECYRPRGGKGNESARREPLDWKKSIDATVGGASSDLTISQLLEAQPEFATHNLAGDSVAEFLWFLRAHVEDVLHQQFPAGIENDEEIRKVYKTAIAMRVEALHAEIVRLKEWETAILAGPKPRKGEHKTPPRKRLVAWVKECEQRGLINKLSRIQKNVLGLFVQGHTPRDIAERLGKTTYEVYQAKSCGIKRLGRIIRRENCVLGEYPRTRVGPRGEGIRRRRTESEEPDR